MKKFFLVLFLIIFLKVNVSAQTKCVWIGKEDSNFLNNNNWENCKISELENSILEFNENSLNLNNNIKELQVNAISISANEFILNGNSITVENKISYKSQSQTTSKINLNLIIANNFQLNIENLGSVIEFNGIISGESLTKNGFGLAIFNGKNSYKNITKIENGEVQINGFQPQSDIYLFNNSRLSGNGQVGNIFLNNNSSVNLSYGQNLKVKGVVQSKNNSTLDFALENESTFSILNVSNGINLNNLNLNISAVNNIKQGSKYKIIEAKEVLGKFSNLENSSVYKINDNNFLVEYNLNSVTLTSLPKDISNLSLPENNNSLILIALSFLIFATIFARIFRKRLTKSKRLSKNFR